MREELRASSPRSSLLQCSTLQTVELSTIPLTLCSHLLNFTHSNNLQCLLLFSMMISKLKARCGEYEFNKCHHIWHRVEQATGTGSWWDVWHWLFVHLTKGGLRVSEWKKIDAVDYKNKHGGGGSVLATSWHGLLSVSSRTPKIRMCCIVSFFVWCEWPVGETRCSR